MSRPSASREMSTTSPGCASPRLIKGSRLCPPARTFAFSPCSRSRSQASEYRSARSYRNARVNTDPPSQPMLDGSRRGRRDPAGLEAEHLHRGLLGHLLQVLVRHADVEQGGEQHPEPLRVRRPGELAQVGAEDEVLPAQRDDPLREFTRLLLPEDR